MRIDKLLPANLLSRVPAVAQGLEISQITSDSREVGPGKLYIAIRGGSADGNQFLTTAARQGAAFLIGTVPAPADLGATPYLQLHSHSSNEEDRAVLAELASTFYGHPSRSMRMVGVTGTSGKTTTTYLIESILRAAGERVGVIGTVSFRFEDRVFPATHTTPGPVDLQRLLSEMKAAGATAVVMEVSSHALKQKRAAGIAWDATAFTNLTPEHLDYHPDLEDYFQSKAILFRELAESSRAVGKVPAAAINLDDAYGRRLQSELTASGSARGFRVASDSQLTLSLDGINGTALGVRVDSALTGAFNASNLMTAILVAQNLRIPADAIAKGIRALPGVPGRLERVQNDRGVHVWVDYAHKPDALEKVLDTLREIRAASGGKGKLITVFGCGGDRDRTKRPVMGRIAAERSDRVIITSDNPRTENPATIIREIVSGVPGEISQMVVEPDRKLAIQRAIREAKAGDLVLIAGKGHEDYQIIGTKKVHLDDREVALEAFRIV